MVEDAGWTIISSALSSALKGRTHPKIVCAGWGDEGSAGQEERGMEDDGEMSRGFCHWNRPSFCPCRQQEEKSWKHQGWIHLKGTNKIKSFQRKRKLVLRKICW